MKIRMGNLMLDVLKNRRLILSVIVCFGLIFTSCTSSQKESEKITIESGEIPPDMAKEDFVLIGRLYERNSYDRYLIKGFANCYAGTSILATKAKIDSSYWNGFKYRYVLDYDLESGSSYIVNGVVAQGALKRFYIYDKVKRIKYKRKSISSNFAKEIKTYLLAIEAVRKK